MYRLQLENVEIEGVAIAVRTMLQQAPAGAERLEQDEGRGRNRTNPMGVYGSTLTGSAGSATKFGANVPLITFILVRASVVALATYIWMVIVGGSDGREVDNYCFRYSGGR
jgi:hypothetical protein